MCDYLPPSPSQISMFDDWYKDPLGFLAKYKDRTENAQEETSTQKENPASHD